MFNPGFYFTSVEAEALRVFLIPIIDLKLLKRTFDFKKQLLCVIFPVYEKFLGVVYVRKF